MQKLKIELENCYGIASLKSELDFSERNQFVMYAPNGAMKSSFAKCFEDLSLKKPSVDRVHPEKESKRVIQDEAGNEIGSESIFVVHPYSETFKSDRVSTLLANQSLRESYESIRAEIDRKKDSLISGLARVSGTKKATEQLLSNDISFENDVFKSLNRIKSEVENNENSHLADIQYSQIFNEKTEEQLNDKDFRDEIANYLQIYNDLTEKSAFFKKGVFNHNNASDVAKNLKSNGFFEAEHSVYVNNQDVRKEIRNEKDLEDFIEKEKESILDDPNLKISFDRIDKILIKNVQLKSFRDYLSANTKILMELENIQRLKSRLWVSYVSQFKSEYMELLETYENGRAKLDEIVSEAKKEATRWAAVLQEFNERFSVPFLVTMENQEDVILKREAPSIAFRFKNSDGSNTNIKEADLVKILSNGEKRALYLLNIIFEVIARRDDNIKTLFVFDDIADSFDYKNKYAIVEYLRDITQEDFFFQIILTHNYDFYRTISGRLDLKRENKIHAIKKPDQIVLKVEKYQNNPLSFWKQEIPKNENSDFLIAAIPFVRNLAEYSENKALESDLTKYLHVKTGSEDLTKGDLRSKIEQLIHFDAPLAFSDDDKKMFDLIFEQADKAASLEEEEIELESKIVLSIAIRLQAERHMIARLGSAVDVDDIKKDQTFFLIKKYEEMFGKTDANLKTLKRVNLMTPENIHLNSFMYEPILDMANVHLKRLYDQVTAL